MTYKFAIFKSSVSTTKQLFQHRALVFALAKRELSEQYAGQLFGNLWSIIHPLFLMMVYLFVFGFVFRTKIGGSYNLPYDYTTYILSGLIPWLTLQQNLAKSCAAITSNAALVKQVVFPIEVLPVKTILSTLVWQLIAIGILLAHVLIRYHEFPASYLFLPLVVLLQLIVTLGISFILSSITVFVRDIREFITIFTTAGVFLLPITYLPAWVPPLFKPFIYLNPFSYLIWCYQDVLYYGRMEHPLAWAVLISGSVCVFMLGTHIFNNLKQLFGNAL